MNLETRLELLAGVGKTTAQKLQKLSLSRIYDLALNLPFRYEDFSQIKKISELQSNEQVTIKGEVELIANRRGFRSRKSITEALVSDQTGSLKVVWFNQPFITKNLKVGDQVFLSGKFDQLKMQMTSPDYERVTGNNIHTARLVPIYHLTEGISQKKYRYLLSQVKKCFSDFNEYLPADLLKRYSFPNIAQALQDIHFPENSKSAEKARSRFAFEELFLIQLAIQKAKLELKSNKAFKLAFLEKQTKDFVDKLPFTLTKAQKKCAWEIIQDLNSEEPMNRLLEGDVGSGKTVVVALGILNVILNGYKVIMLAPTEILATQHYESLSKMLGKYKFNICLMTGSKRLINNEKITRPKLLEKLDQGEVDLIIGTHAVIQDQVKVKDLGLVIVDEQHRFGVKQRKALIERGKNGDLIPHFLSMTATPIPRSMVLSLYGDLDLSIINEMPPGRKPIITRVVFEAERFKAYEFIQKQIVDGRQVFVICPLIDPSDKLGFKSVKQEYEKLDKQIFPDLKIGLMHGRLKGAEKEKVMTDFYNKKYQILVSTSVIEVGIDVPNATIIMIEGADRFGLAQLHQFRGRVGRGEFQSYCFLFSSNTAPKIQERLKFMEKCNDGFTLAEKDLELRGPGEVYGTRQSGLPDLKVASLTDVKAIEIAQKEAKELLVKGNINSELQSRLDKVQVTFHFE